MPAPTAPALNLERVERETILEALQVCEGNRTLAAKALGISKQTLNRRLAAYALIQIGQSQFAAESAMPN